VYPLYKDTSRERVCECRHTHGVADKYHHTRCVLIRSCKLLPDTTVTAPADNGGSGILGQVRRALK
jgi:hypothetical protein